MATITLEELQVHLNDFGKATKQEQNVFLESLNILNDLFILRKCMAFSVTFLHEPEKIVRGAANSQAIFFSNMLSGVIFEAVTLIKKGLLGKSKKSAEENLIDKYGQLFDKKSLQNLRLILRYFPNKKHRNRQNMLDLIRNEFGFHYGLRNDTDFINKVSEENRKLFLHETHGNCFYELSNSIKIRNLMEKIAREDWTQEKAIEKILDIPKKIGDCVADILGAYIMVFIRTYLNKNKTTPVTLSNIKKIDAVDMPYFVTR